MQAFQYFVKNKLCFSVLKIKERMKIIWFDLKSGFEIWKMEIKECFKRDELRFENRWKNTRKKIGSFKRGENLGSLI